MTRDALALRSGKPRAARLAREGLATFVLVMAILTLLSSAMVVNTRWSQQTATMVFSESLGRLPIL